MYIRNKHVHANAPGDGREREIHQTSIMGPPVLTHPKYTAELIHLKCFQRQPPRCNAIMVQTYQNQRERFQL